MGLTEEAVLSRSQISFNAINYTTVYASLNGILRYAGITIAK
jgi:hypothetical protein